jgi:Domain of unknown function (DUF6430)
VSRSLGGVRVLRPPYAARMVLGTARGLRQLVTNVLVAFGLVSGIIQFIGQLFPSAFHDPGAIAAGSLGVCLVWAVVRVYPRGHIRHEFHRPDMVITVDVGDLFEQDAHLVVGFADTFDTSTDDRVISNSSVQGQLIDRLYGGDARQLDKELRSALARVTPVATERRQNKRLGNLRRYPVGTVAVVGEPHRRVFGVAYSRMGNDLVAKSTVQEWWLSLSNLWDAIYQHGQNESVAIPLVGSGLARLNFLDRQNLLKMIIMSFVARSRESVVCRELRIVIWPPDLADVDLVEAGAFLRAL